MLVKFPQGGVPRKKVLALVLTLALALSVAAGAAFTDQKQIKNTEAVDACVALNIIGGYPDGSYKPEGNITRAEFTKMLCVLLNGGKEPTLGTAVKPTFTDVSTSANAAWAEKYIESCVAQGIVSGIGGGKFAPNSSVTGSQAAKMLLVALGYKSDIETFTGAAWEVNVNVKATEKGLYDGLAGIDTSKALTRDNAAQMVWNALQAKEVKYDYTLVSENGQLVSKITLITKDETLMEDKYDAQTFTGTFEGNSDTLNLKDGQIRVNGRVDENKDPANANFKYDFDLKYLGEEVKVLFKDATGGTKNVPDDKDTIYGVYVTGETTVYNITKNDLQTQKDAGTVRFGDKNYDVAGIVATAAKPVEYLNINSGADKTGTTSKDMTAEQVATAFNNLKATSPDTIKFICNDNGDIVKAYVVTYKLARVTAVNSEKISINNSVGTIKIADNDVYKGIAKDDIVVVSTLYNSDATNADAYSIVTKADVVEGKLTGYKTSSTGAVKVVKQVSVDKTTYDVVGDTLTTYKDVDSDFVDNLDNQINETVKVYLVNGIAYAVEMVTESSQYAVVEASTGTLNDTFDPLKIKMMKADGKEVTVEIHKDSKVTTTADLTIGTIIKYSDVSDGKIKITEATNAPATVTKTEIYDKDTKQFDKKVAAADGILFVNKTTDVDKAGDFYVYTIRNLNDITTSANAKTTKIVDDGKVVAAYVTLSSKPSGASSDTVYGIVSSANGIVKDGDDTYTSWTVQLDGDRANDKTVLIEGESAYLDEGYLVGFDVASDNIYSKSDITIYLKNTGNNVNTSVAVAVAVDEYDVNAQIITYWTSGSEIGKDNVSSKHTLAVDKDVKVVYVSAEDNEASAAAGSYEYDGVKNTKNALVVFNDNQDKVVAIFFDIDGDITQ